MPATDLTIARTTVSGTGKSRDSSRAATKTVGKGQDLPNSRKNDAAVISLSDVVVRFGETVAIENLNFAVRPGEIVALVGKTGAGKSTALNLVMGNLKPTAGQVRVLGLDPYEQFRQLRGRLSVSFQTDRLLPWRTAQQNVQLGLQILKMDPRKVRDQAADWLHRVKLEDAAEQFPHELSGGMRQRVSLARALAVNPEILLLDESFSQLDHITSQTLRRDVSELIRSLKKTCLFITHRIDDALEMADRILVLAAPAKIVLETSLRDVDKTDAEAMRKLHDRITGALDT